MGADKVNTSAARTTPDGADDRYYDKISRPVTLSDEDERAIAYLVGRCRGCGELLRDGCLPGCTDRD